MPYFIKNRLKFTQFSIPKYPGAFIPHVFIVKVYPWIGISKQLLSTNVSVCINVELIGQLSAYQLQCTQHVQVILIS